MSLYISLVNCFLALIMMIYNLRVNRNSIFLGLLIFFLSSYAITAYFLIENQNRFWIAIFLGHPAPLWFLPGPLLYFYTRGTLEDKVRLQKWDGLHLIPSFIALVGIFPYMISPFERKLQLADAIIHDLQAPKYLGVDWLIPFEVNLLIRPSVMILYSLFCIGMVLKAQKRLSQSTTIPYHQWQFSRKWLLLLSFLFVVLSIPSLIISIYYYLGISATRDQVSANVFTQIMGYSLTFLSLILILFPQVLYGIPRSGKEEDSNSAAGNQERQERQQAKLIVNTGPINYMKGNKIESDPFYELGERVLKVMKEKKPYLNYDFSLDDLADLLEVPKHHLYYCFHNVLHTKFTRLRTEYRIEHAKQLLIESDFRKVTLDSVGRDSGFASKSGFYNTFKAEVGCSPGEFAQSHNQLEGK